MTRPPQRATPVKTAKTAKTTAKPRAPKAPVAKTPLLEWLAAGVGIILVVATLGLIGSEAFRNDRSPPQITVRALEVRPSGAGYLVTVRAENLGGSPAAGVAVEGELRRPDGTAETAEASFDFIPDHSSRDGGLFFQSDPRGGGLALTAKGYSEP